MSEHKTGYIVLETLSIPFIEVLLGQRPLSFCHTMKKRQPLLQWLS